MNIRNLIIFAKQLLTAERTPKKLAHASAVGVFIAFSPLMGLHWLLTIIFSTLWRLNIGVVYVVSHINNPFTMLPMYLGGYAFGLYILRLLHIDGLAHNPWWMDWFNAKIACLGIPNVSLWAFLIGGHVLGLILGLISYPFFHMFYKKIIRSPVQS